MYKNPVRFSWLSSELEKRKLMLENDEGISRGKTANPMTGTTYALTSLLLSRPQGPAWVQKKPASRCNEGERFASYQTVTFDVRIPLPYFASKPFSTISEES